MVSFHSIKKKTNLRQQCHLLCSHFSWDTFGFTSDIYEHHLLGTQKTQPILICAEVGQVGKQLDLITAGQAVSWRVSECAKQPRHKSAQGTKASFSLEVIVGCQGRYQIQPVTPTKQREGIHTCLLLSLVSASVLVPILTQFRDQTLEMTCLEWVEFPSSIIQS